MVFQISQSIEDPRRLTQAVLQIVDMLDLFQAELARILHVKCGDIGELAGARCCLEPGTKAWEQARLLVRCYRALFEHLHGDGVAMRHWLRVPQPGLEDVPHLLIVDHDGLRTVVDYLENSASRAEDNGVRQRVRGSGDAPE